MKLFSIARAACLLFLLAGCSVSFTTAHITELTTSRNKDGTQPASAFGLNDPIYAKVVIANNIGKVTMKWQLIAEKVEDLPEHKALPEADASFDLNGDGKSMYTLTPPASGWPAGTYTIKVGMLDETGAEKDKRSATVTMAGAAKTAHEQSVTTKDALSQTKDAIAHTADSGAANTEFGGMEFSDSKGGEPADAFALDTAEIFMQAKVTGLPKGAKVTATWIAEKVVGAAPETKIAGKDLIMEGEADTLDFSLTRPNNGWPVGNYRVDLSVDGKIVESGQFDMEK